MVVLRNETDDRRRLRNGLRDSASRARRDLAALEDDCARENEQWEKCISERARMEGEGARARSEATILQAEVDQAHLHQETLEENMHRSRCNVENLKIELDRESIRMRHLINEQRDLELELKQLWMLRNAQQIVEADQKREIEEARTTQSMYQANHDSLTLHLRSIGGDPHQFRFSSFFRNKYKKDIYDEQNPQITAKASDNIQKSQVGGVFFGADTRGGESSNFLQKLLPAFKMSDNCNSGVAASANRQQHDYVLRKFMELEFTSDSQSQLNVSTITMDGDETWKDSLSDR